MCDIRCGINGFETFVNSDRKINNWAGIETGEEKTNEAHKSHNLTMRTKQRCCA